MQGLEQGLEPGLEQRLEQVLEQRLEPWHLLQLPLRTMEEEGGHLLAVDSGPRLLFLIRTGRRMKHGYVHLGGLEGLRTVFREK